MVRATEGAVCSTNLSVDCLAKVGLRFIGSPLQVVFAHQRPRPRAVLDLVIRRKEYGGTRWAMLQLGDRLGSAHRQEYRLRLLLLLERDLQTETWRFHASD
jgi:hypothetical protein